MSQMSSASTDKREERKQKKKWESKKAKKKGFFSASMIYCCDTHVKTRKMLLIKNLKKKSLHMCLQKDLCRAFEKFEFSILFDSCDTAGIIAAVDDLWISQGENYAFGAKTQPKRN